MSLPTKAIDRLFHRLAATYGSEWDRSIGVTPLNDVKTAWAHELSGFASPEGMQCIAWALENLPERAPNVIQFKHLCRKAPMPEMPQLPEPQADPQRMKSELAKLGAILNKPKESMDGLGWARQIIAKRDAGMKVASLPLRMATEALQKKSYMNPD